MKKLINAYNKIEKGFLIFCLVLMTVILFVQVIARFVFNSSFTWSEEAARYIFIWMIWMSASYGVSNGSHIRVEIIADKLKGKARDALELLVDLIVLSSNILMCYLGIVYTARHFVRGTLSNATRFPLWIVYLAFPVGTGLVSLRMIANCVQDIGILVKGHPAKDNEETDKKEDI